MIESISWTAWPSDKYADEDFQHIHLVLTETFMEIKHESTFVKSNTAPMFLVIDFVVQGLANGLLSVVAVRAFDALEQAVRQLGHHQRQELTIGCRTRLDSCDVEVYGRKGDSKVPGQQAGKAIELAYYAMKHSNNVFGERLRCLSSEMSDIEPGEHWSGDVHRIWFLWQPETQTCVVKQVLIDGEIFEP